jgi:hypothetical protein
MAQVNPLLKTAAAASIQAVEVPVFSLYLSGGQEIEKQQDKEI